MISWVLWFACGGTATVADGTPPEAPKPDAPTPEPPPAPKEPPNTTIAVKWAWPAAGGGYVVAPGNVLGTTAITPATGEPCGQDVHVDGGFVFGTVPAAPEAFKEPPPNQAATLERGAWRLSEALGPREGIVPGLSGTEAPARQLGTNVRTLRKTRRPNGPPLYLGVGSRDGKVAVALFDSELEKVLSSDVFPWTGSSRLEVSPITDVDGDGRLELLVGSDDATRSLRAAWRVDLAGATLTRAQLETAGAKTCP